MKAFTFAVLNTLCQTGLYCRRKKKAQEVSYCVSVFGINKRGPTVGMTINSRCCWPNKEWSGEYRNSYLINRKFKKKEDITTSGTFFDCNTMKSSEVLCKTIKNEEGACCTPIKASWLIFIQAFSASRPKTEATCRTRLNKYLLGLSWCRADVFWCKANPLPHFWPYQINNSWVKSAALKILQKKTYKTRSLLLLHTLL